MTAESGKVDGGRQGKATAKRLRTWVLDYLTPQETSELQ